MGRGATRYVVSGFFYWILMEANRRMALSCAASCFCRKNLLISFGIQSFSMIVISRRPRHSVLSRCKKPRVNRSEAAARLLALTLDIS